MRPSGAGQVGDVREADEGHEVVLAERGEGNVAHHDHLVVADLEGDAQVLARVGLDALEQLDVHVGDPPRRLEESLAVGVLADGFEQLANRVPAPAAWSTTAQASPMKV